MKPKQTCGNCEHFEELDQDPFWEGKGMCQEADALPDVILVNKKSKCEKCPSKFKARAGK